MKILSHEKIIFYMLFGAFHGTPPRIFHEKFKRFHKKHQIQRSVDITVVLVQTSNTETMVHGLDNYFLTLLVTWMKGKRTDCSSSLNNSSVMTHLKSNALKKYKNSHW